MAYSDGLESIPSLGLTVSQFTLTLSVEGSGLTSPVAGASTHIEGAVVQLSASPQSGSKFIRWEGDGVEDTEADHTQITMDSNRTVKAVFSEEVILNIVSAGGGTTIPPPGAISYTKGEVITIKAIPNEDYKFKEWSGDISSTSDVYEFTITADTTVGATFEEDAEGEVSKKKLYFATAKEKAFWRVDNRWRFFATPVHTYLKKLDADDHKQYLNNSRHDTTERHTLGEVIPHDSHENLSNIGYYTHETIDEHLENINNPHLVTASQVGAIPDLSGTALPVAGAEYRRLFFTVTGEVGPPAVEDKLYYCRSTDGGTTYEWKEIIFT